MAKKIITPIATLSYPHVAAPQPLSAKDMKAGKKPKYGVALVFAPGTDLTGLQAAILEAATDKWGGKAKSVIAGQRYKTLRDDVADKPGYPEGAIFLNARSEDKPGCVYAWPDPVTGKPALVPDAQIGKQFYPGAQVRASITAFAYDTDGNKGVSFGLNNLQFVADGPRLDGRKAATEEFESDPNAMKPADLTDVTGEGSSEDDDLPF